MRGFRGYKLSHLRQSVNTRVNEEIRTARVYGH